MVFSLAPLTFVSTWLCLAPAAGGEASTQPQPSALTPPTDEVDEADTQDQGDAMDAIFGSPSDHAHLEEVRTPAVTATIADTTPVAVEARPAWQKGLDFDFRLSSSVQFDIDDLHEGRRWHRSAERRGRISRNENRLGFRLNYAPNAHIEIVGDASLVFMGVDLGPGLGDRASQQRLARVHLESDAAYVAVYDLFPGFDIKFGRQIVVWGTADKFNPTNNLNPDDLEDRPGYMTPIANQMLVVDYAPLDDALWMQAVYVPLFYPGLVPPSVADGIRDTDAPVPFAERTQRDEMRVLSEVLRARPDLVPRMRWTVHEPEKIAKSGQYGARLGTTLGNLDASVSYFFGFHDLPLPMHVTSTPLDEDAPESEGYRFESEVHLLYPRMHVWGADFSTQVAFLDDMGFWGEAALILPQQDYRLHVELPALLDLSPEGSQGAQPKKFVRGWTAARKPFVKATVGLDYSFGKHVYVQLQYLRGFIDEFGAGTIGDYLVGGTELAFRGRRIRARIFGVLDVSPTDEAPISAVIAPEFSYTPPWGHVTLHLGGFGFIGRFDSKFGQRATGASIVHMKMAGAF